MSSNKPNPIEVNANERTNRIAGNMGSMLTDQQIANKNRRHDQRMKRTLSAHMPERYFRGRLEREFDENGQLVKLNWDSKTIRKDKNGD